jgi:hypothetical protein
MNLHLKPALLISLLLLVGCAYSYTPLTPEEIAQHRAQGASIVISPRHHAVYYNATNCMGGAIAKELNP